MFRLQANKNRLTLLENELITSGSLNVYDVYFTFDNNWDGLEKTAVFKTGGCSGTAVALDEENHCIVPWDVLENKYVNSVFKIGVFGLKGKELILPTIWVDAGVLKRGAYSSDETKPKDPDLYQQLLESLGKYQDHQNLTNRDAKDAHPVESISGLEEIDSLDVIQMWNGTGGVARWLRNM